jgi:hypothetical protein
LLAIGRDFVHPAELAAAGKLPQFFGLKRPLDSPAQSNEILLAQRNALCSING